MAALRAPLTGIIRVTDIFGTRRDLDDGSSYSHGGIDLALRGQERQSGADSRASQRDGRTPCGSTRRVAHTGTRWRCLDD